MLIECWNVPPGTVGKSRIPRLANGKWVPSNKNSWQWQVISKMDLKWMMLVLLGLCWWKFMHKWHYLIKSTLTSFYTLTSIDNQQTTIKCHPLMISACIKFGHPCETRFQTIGGLSIVHYKEMGNIRFHISFCFQTQTKTHPKITSCNQLRHWLFVRFISRGLGTLLWTFLLIFILMYVGAIVGMEPWPFVLACFCVCFFMFFLRRPIGRRVNLGKKDE